VASVLDATCFPRTRFTGEIWVIYLSGARSAHPTFACSSVLARSLCSISTGIRRDVLSCKKHTGAFADHDHVMNVSAQVARNSGLRVRINREVATTATSSNKQGDVQVMEFGIPGYDVLVWDVSLVCDRIGSSTQYGLNGKLQLGDYLNARARIKIGKFRRDYAAAKNIAFALSILSIAGKIHPKFLRLLWVLADIQTVKYFDLVGNEEDIGNERCKWNRASTFSYTRNAIGLAIAYASAIRTHLSVHGTNHPMSAASVRP